MYRDHPIKEREQQRERLSGSDARSRVTPASTALADRLPWARPGA